MSELKPCPFCGNIGSFWSTDQCQTLYATCIFCGARTVDCDTPEEAIAAWNRRAESDAAPVVRGEWMPTDMGGGETDEAYVCSACGEPWTLIDGTPAENNMHYCPNCGAKMEDKPCG